MLEMTLSRSGIGGWDADVVISTHFSPLLESSTNPSDQFEALRSAGAR
jgi:hypothetical protein